MPKRNTISNHLLSDDLGWDTFVISTKKVGDISVIPIRVPVLYIVFFKCLIKILKSLKIISVLAENRTYSYKVTHLTQK
jgi:hypothetical protein